MAHVGEVPVNPMHAELLTRVGKLCDEYLNDGMPVDNVAATMCVCAGLLIKYHYDPAIYDVALEACVANIREGFRVK